jgi:hypothetical protein
MAHAHGNPDKETHIQYPAGPVQPRNTIDRPTRAENASAQTDAQSLKVPPADQAQAARVVALASAHMMKMIRDQAFDYTHPVDEYAPQGGNQVIPANGIITVQSDYDMPEKIESVLVIVPVGATSAALQLGQRLLTLYAGAALTAPLLWTVPYAGIILNSDDPRILTMTGGLTSPPYLGLTGYALTRGQFS